jgi:DNA-binding phage protein
VVFPGDPSSDLFAENYGPSISSLTQLSSFLTDAFGLHSQFPAADERTPQVLSSSILSEETSTHAELDAWSPPAGISVYAVSGWGNLTPFQYSYTASPAKQLSCFRTGVVGFSCSYGLQVTHDAENTESGDNTVVSTSAVANDTNQAYFNAKSFAANKDGNIGHSNLTSAQPIQSYLKDILTNKDSSGIAYLSSTTPSGGTNPLTSPLAVVSVHSPVNVIATDANGNQTGIFPVAGKPGIYVEKENIPGSSLQVLDDEKYLYVPSTASYTISLQGYDDGLTTIDLGSVDAQGNTSTAVEFSDVPTTADTSASFSLPPLVPNQASSASSIPAGTNFPTTIAVDVFGTGSTSPVSATFIAGVSNATTSASSSPTTNTTSTPQQSLPELFSLLEHIGIAHHLSKVIIDAEFTKLQKDSPTDAGKEITSIEQYVENHLQNVIGTSEETLIIELLEEVRTALAAPGGP